MVVAVYYPGREENGGGSDAEKVFRLYEYGLDQVFQWLQ